MMITNKHIPVKPGHHTVEVPWSIPSIKNSDEIRLAPKLWGAIRPMVEKVKQLHRIRRPYCISPNRRLKQFEENLAAWFALYLPDLGDGPINVVALVYQRIDVDKSPGSILDALQKSRRIINDRQVECITIRRVQGIGEPIVDVTPVATLQKTA